MTSESAEPQTIAPDPKSVSDFWELARNEVGWTRLEFLLGSQQESLVEPPWMHLSPYPDKATALVLELREEGKAQVVTPRDAYPEDDKDLPKVGDLTIVCTGDGLPAALVMTTEVSVLDHDGDSIVEEKLRCLHPRQRGVKASDSADVPT